jgi:hypothetical protein
VSEALIAEDEMIRGLRDYWAGLTGRGEPMPFDMAARIRLDALGLGLGQVISHLLHNRPDFTAFETWIAETAGEPDPLTLARYHAWLDGGTQPEGVRARLAAIDAMPPVLDDADLAQWERDGYVILRNAVSPDQAAAAADLLWGIVCATPDDPGSKITASASIMIEQYQSAAQDALRRSPRVHKAYAQLWGTPDLWTTIDRMSFNAPVTRQHTPSVGVRLHWDVSLTLPIPFATQGILYLTDTSADQGALELVPGFHRRVESWLAEVGNADPRHVDFSAEAITIPANAGDLVIWHQALPHSASPNRAAHPRLAQYLNMYSPALITHEEWR